MSRALDANLDILKRVRQDLLRLRKADAKRGREGMSAEQVLRAALLKQMFSFSYSELSFHLGDSSQLRGFCRLSPSAKAPMKSALQSNIGSLRAETWERANKAIVLHARACTDVDNGLKNLGDGVPGRELASALVEVARSPVGRKVRASRDCGRRLG